MANKNEIARLRAEVRARHRAATQKISRTRRVIGAELGGTEFDPRRDPAKVKNYNSVQLKAYLTDLNRFSSRSTAFVAGNNARPIPAQEWRSYRRAERNANRVGQNIDNSVGGIFIPNAGMTIAERDAERRARSPRAQGGAVNSSFPQVNRSASNVTSRQALAKLTAQMESRVTPEYEKRSARAGRVQMNRMIDAIGNSAMRAKASKLTPEQFHVLWEKTNFAESLSNVYGGAAMAMEQSSERWVAATAESYGSDVDELLDWASKLEVPKWSSQTQKRKQEKRAPRRR